MNRRTFLSAAPAFVRATTLRSDASSKPNIIWITGEDMGKDLGCYGFPLVQTPNLDRLAAEGVRFDSAHTTAPVCSASRSAFNTGVYQIHSGAHHHRSHRKDGWRLPNGIEIISKRLHAAGYYTTNPRGLGPTLKASGKTDFNFTTEDPFDSMSTWRTRRPGQPVFAHVNFTAPHKGPQFPRARRENKHLIDPAKLELPPYWPDHPTVRDEFANYLDAVNLLDADVGGLWRELKNDGLLDNALVFFFGDNGRCLIRGKQWLYDAGTSIPLIAWASGDAARRFSLSPGKVRKDLCLSLDFTATSLLAAGLPLPNPCHGQSLFGSKPRTEIYTARDRCDMTLDRIRAVRTNRYKYIRNFMPERPYTQFNNYIETSYPTLAVMKQLAKEGKLTPAQSLFMASQKPPEELYDLQSDPHEIHNLAASPQHQSTRRALAKKLDAWLETIDDKGRHPEDPKAAEL